MRGVGEERGGRMRGGGGRGGEGREDWGEREEEEEGERGRRDLDFFTWLPLHKHNPKHTWLLHFWLDAFLKLD